MIILQANHVYKNYGEKENEVKALKNISISVEEGTFTTIIGQSGSGKSTLLHVLGGLDKPNKGSVILDDIDIYKLSEDELTILRRRKVGFVF